MRRAYDGQTLFAFYFEIQIAKCKNLARSLPYRVSVSGLKVNQVFVCIVFILCERRSFIFCSILRCIVIQCIRSFMQNCTILQTHLCLYHHSNVEVVFFFSFRFRFVCMLWILIVNIAENDETVCDWLILVGFKRWACAKYKRFFFLKLNISQDSYGHYADIFVTLPIKHWKVQRVGPHIATTSFMIRWIFGCYWPLCISRILSNGNFEFRNLLASKVY